MSAEFVVSVKPETLIKENLKMHFCFASYGQAGDVVEGRRLLGKKATKKTNKACTDANHTTPDLRCSL